MGRKKKMTITILCEKCGAEPKRNEKLSNDNWNVIDNNPCTKCNGKLTFKIIHNT